MELKQNYNKLLKRYDAAEIWFDDPKRTEEEIKKHEAEFFRILVAMSKILTELKAMGIEVSETEALEGFKW